MKILPILLMMFCITAGHSIHTPQALPIHSERPASIISDAEHELTKISGSSTRACTVSTKSNFTVEDSTYKEHPCKHIKIGENGIYLPTDGYLPPSEEVVNWCSANAENNQVTDWFMMMYGLKEHEGAFWQNGFDENGNATKIINFGSSMNDGMQKSYLQNFEKIASNSVGRVTLYVMLLEIKRSKANVGCPHEGIKISDENLIKRNKCRSLTVEWDVEGNSFSFSEGKIYVFANDPDGETMVITDAGIEPRPRPDDVGMFHEMLHWLHFLRYTDRYICERSVDAIHKLNKTCTIKGITINLGSLYFGELSNDNIKISQKYWKKEKTYYFKFEEIRTILGSSRKLDSSFIEYDDLSENLYRLCIGEPLRYGHNTFDGIGKSLPEFATVTKTCTDSFSGGHYQVCKR